MSQPQLARLVGVPQQTVSNHELGKAEPDLATLIRYAHVLGGRVDQLLGLEALPAQRADDSSPGILEGEQDRAPSPPMSSHSGDVGGDAVQQMDAPTSAVAWMRIAERMVALMESQDQTRRFRAEHVDAVDAQARAAVASAALVVAEQAKETGGPRIYAGPALGERRGSTAGGDPGLPADTNGDGRAAG
jgi:DNA-binding XRE family transcriptional regulator